MDVAPYLNPRGQEALQLPLSFEERCRLRVLFGEELIGEPVATRRKPIVSTGETYFDTENRTTDAGNVLCDGRTWTVVDTEFGCRYLVLVDYNGGFIMLSLAGGIDVVVEFDRPVDTSDRPTHRYEETRYDPVPSRNRQQYLLFKSIAAKLIAEHEANAHKRQQS